MNNIVHTTGLSKQFGRQWALEDLSLQVPKGSLFGLLGPNGAGKSTTLNMLLGLTDPTAGKIELFDQPWQRSSLARVGAMINGPKFYAHLTVWENVHLHAILLDLGKTEIEEVLQKVKLEDATKKRGSQLSTGMKTRLGLAIALLGNPELLVLDEPQNGLDPQGIRELRAILRGQVEQGMTVLLSSHLLLEVAQLVDHVAILGNGQLKFQGPIDELVQPEADLEQVYFDVLEREVTS